MNAKQILFSLTVLSTLLLGGATQALAQEDESWYKENVRQWHEQQATRDKSARTLKPNGRQLPATESTNARDACELEPNGDFESQQAPPMRTGNMVEFTSDVSNWYSPTQGSPDYFSNASGSAPSMKPRTGINGSFSPLSGDGAIALYARQSYSGYDRVSEYATTQLPTTLGGANERYYLQFWVSLSQNRSIANCGINNGFGCVLTPNLSQIQGSGRDFITPPITPQVLSGSIGQSAVNLGPGGSGNWQRVSGQFPGNNANYMTLGLFNSDPNNFFPLNGGSMSTPNAYVFVDNVELYKIPTAGPPASCTGAGVQIGEGCPIPYAKYEWRVSGNSYVIASTLKTTVRPTGNTTYSLTVILPDNSQYTTTTAVAACPCGDLAYPDVTQDDPEDWRNKNQARFYINNFDPNLTYTVTNIQYANPTIPHPTYGTFIVKGGYGNPGPVYYGYFTITVTDPNCGQSITTDPIPVEYRIGTTPGGRTASSEATTAYPNPAAESITIPDGADGATLVNDKGKTLRTADSSGKLDVQSLPDGLYNLQMMQNGKLINQLIQVKH